MHIGVVFPKLIQFGHSRPCCDMNPSTVSGDDWETPFKSTLMIQNKILQLNAHLQAEMSRRKIMAKHPGDFSGPRISLRFVLRTKKGITQAQGCTREWLEGQ